jgi:cell division protein FtsQ
MPLSSNFTARVPLVSGRLIEKIAKICRVIAVIYDDDFEKNIISIEIMPNGRLKCSIGTIIIKLILEYHRYGAKV